MSLHNEIMNIQIHRNATRGRGNDFHNGYQRGHRDARHEAAELALKADALLEAALRFVPLPENMAGFDDDDAPEEVREMIELAKWIREQTK